MNLAAGSHKLQWMWVKDAGVSRGKDMARIKASPSKAPHPPLDTRRSRLTLTLTLTLTRRVTPQELAVVGFNDDQACTACPAGYCSTGGLRGCERCGSSATSSAGSATCSACTNPKPYNAHFTGLSSSGAAALCDWECDVGYDKLANRCIPRQQKCYLPEGDKVAGKFDPPTFDMMKQCFFHLL